MKSRKGKCSQDMLRVGVLLLFSGLSVPSSFGAQSFPITEGSGPKTSSIELASNSRPPDREMIRPPVIPRIPPR